MDDISQNEDTNVSVRTEHCRGMNGSRGKKLRNWGKREKVRQKREETSKKKFPPSGCKIDFSARGGGE